jgi:hypothetical protein
MGPLPLSVCISVYICRVCVWYNVVGKDPRWGPLRVYVCMLVCISVLYVSYIMLSVRAQYKGGVTRMRSLSVYPRLS